MDNLPTGTGCYDSSFQQNLYADTLDPINRFNLTKVTPEQMSTLLKSVNAGKATGLDNIPARFVKDGTIVISKPLCHIFNMSVNSGVFPNELKSARVVPLYKKGSKTCSGNYRPVSILSIVSKVYERIVYYKLINYIEVNDLLYTLQSGFRSKYSTDTCLIHLLVHLRLQTDQGNMTGMVVLNLQKAFDTVNHVILLDKMVDIGVSLESVKWFKSYLCNRSQIVDVNGELSESMSITCGVPQGSILGGRYYS